MSESAGGAPTITCGSRRRIQAESHERAGRLAAAFVAAGIRGGDRVAVMARNDIEFLETSLAAATCGANPVPVNTRWRAPEVAHLLSDAGVRLVIAHTEFVGTVEAALASIGSDAAILEIPMSAELIREARLHPELEQTTGRHELFDDWIDRQPQGLGHVEGAIADSMGLIYTSGTTGRPKGVLRERMTPQQLLSIAGATAQRMGLAPGGQMLVAGPLYHTSPNAVAVLALRMGTNITIMPRWDAERFLQLVQEHRIQHAKVVPTMLSRLLSLPPETRARYDISSLTHLIHSAAPCPPAVKRAAIDWFGDALWEFYGCSEAGAISWIDAADWQKHPGSVGRPLDGAGVTILDEHGNTVPTGETGRVFIKRADYWPDFGYLNRNDTPPATPMITVGDLGYLDEEGYLYLTGRDSEVVISGGVNIYPAEIETAISELAEVEDVAVFSVPDRGDLGERIAAHIIPRPGATLTEDDVRAALEGKLAAYKLPTVIRIVGELPRDDSGKVYKRQLRELYPAS
ncbi:AMP-binding protein [Nocardia yamanashiensis]|uniref:AMP-binding protein n=1 Tax=Nocardia yamanashiensis TaxID=209247 RepID=UPI001E4C453B|nr:AMP-binding protein [Nocardia yamanashiensis]UGT44858.1 AMP-binding protein [Nocardia yamanashiensis]